jgi:hypothetical protein
MRSREVIEAASILSRTEQTAVAECGKAGGLYKQRGVRRGSSLGPRIKREHNREPSRDGF